MKFNVVVRKFAFARHSPDPAAPKEENTAVVEASNGHQKYTVSCGEDVYVQGSKLRLELRDGKPPRLLER